MSRVVIGIDPSTTKYMYPVLLTRTERDTAYCVGWRRLPPVLSGKQGSPDEAVRHAWVSFFREAREEHGSLLHLYVEDQHVVRLTKSIVRLAQTAGWLIGTAGACGIMADIVPLASWRSRIHITENGEQYSLQSPRSNPKKAALAFIETLPITGPPIPRSIKQDDAAESVLIALSQLYPTGVTIL